MRRLCRNNRSGHRAGPAHEKGMLFCIHCGEQMGSINSNGINYNENELKAGSKLAIVITAISVIGGIVVSYFLWGQ